MQATDRRNVLAGLAFAATIGAVPGVLARDRPESATSAFVPPTGPVLLQRRLVRGLSDGERIVVEREWAVEFVPTADGYGLHGKQSAVAVDVPDGLEALADIERSRTEAGFFPLGIDRLGLIASERYVLAQESVALATAAAMQIFDSRDLDPSERGAAAAFLRGIHSSASQGISKMPRDLFLPRQLSYREERSLPVSAQQSGSLAIDFSARLAPSGACLEFAQRTISTRLGDVEQVSSETWKLQG